MKTQTLTKDFLLSGQQPILDYSYTFAFINPQENGSALIEYFNFEDMPYLDYEIKEAKTKVFNENAALMVLQKIPDNKLPNYGMPIAKYA